MFRDHGYTGYDKEMGGDHGNTGRAEQVVSRRWVVTTAIQGGQRRLCQGDGCCPQIYSVGRAGRIKEMGGFHGYTGRAEHGVSSRCVVNTAIQEGQSSESQGDGWSPRLYRAAEQGVSTTCVVTTAIQGGQSLENQRHVW